MKKFALLCICGAVAAAVLTGCASSDSMGTVKLGEYKGVSVDVPAVEVTDEELNSKIQSILVANPEYVEVDRAAQKGDIVNIDYVGTQDGVEFAGGSATGFDLTLGSNRLIDGFEDGLIGVKKGEKRELNLTFPENYDEAALAGQAVVFDVTVNAVKEKHDAVLDNAFVQRVSPFKTVEEFEEDTKADLLTEKQRQVDSQKQQQALQQVVDASTVKLNRSAVSKRYNQELDNYKAQAKAFGTTLSGMAQSYGTDEGGLKEMIMASVKADMTRQLVVDTIAGQENLVADDADRQAFAEANGTTADALVANYGEEAVAQMVQNYKVMKFLGDNAVAKSADETQAAAEETTQAQTESKAQ